MINFHLVILKKLYLEAILQGQKRLEARLTKTKRPFFGNVHTGDILFLKQSSGYVCAKAKVEKALHLENLTPEKIQSLKDQYNGQILAEDSFWNERMHSKYGLLVWLKDVEAIEPVRIAKRDWRAWVVLTKTKNFGLIET